MTSAHRRSGSAVIEYIHEVGLVPTALYMAGVGVSAQEACVFKERWPDADVIGFEPNPYAYEGLKPAFPGNLLNMAIADKPGKQSLYFRHSWKNGSTLHKTTGPMYREVQVEVTTLDEAILPEKGAVLWLDCEGYELKALQGAEEFIKSVSLVNIEITGRPRSGGWASPKDVHQWLKNHGFEQVYVHSIRTVRGQFDAVYLRRELVKPDMCACLDTLG